MKNILILANNDIGLYKFRKELIQKLLEDYKIYISLPNGEFVASLVEMGCEYIETPIDRRGVNPISDMVLFFRYIGSLRKTKPKIVLTYTIKPNIYGGLACRVFKIPYIANITGLGSTVENGGIILSVILNLYKVALKKASCVFFQNKKNQEYLNNKKVVKNNCRLIPGSGVNLNQHKFESYTDDSTIKFLFIGRVMKEKGIDEFLQASEIVKTKYPNSEFHIVGWIEEKEYEKVIEDYKDIIIYHGIQKDVRPFIKFCHAIVLPSYHEGTSNVLLEAASTGRPILASKVTGCIETFDEGVSGLGFSVKSVESLVKSMIEFINYPMVKKIKMGLAGRAKMENEFDRDIIINSYIQEINKIVEVDKNGRLSKTN